MNHELTHGELKEMAYDLLGMAKVNLSKDGWLTPAAFLLKDGKCDIVGLQGAPSKVAARRIVYEMASKEDVDAVIQINDAYIRKDLEQKDADNYAPGQLAEDPRAGECVVVACKTADHSYDFIVTQEYHRDEHGEIKYDGEPLYLAGSPDNLFINMIQDWRVPR